MVCNYILGYILSLVYNIWRNCHECFHLFRFRIIFKKPKSNIYLEPFLLLLTADTSPEYLYLTYYPNIGSWHITRLLIDYPDIGSWYITHSNIGSSHITQLPKYGYSLILNPNMDIA